MSHIIGTYGQPINHMQNMNMKSIGADVTVQKLSAVKHVPQRTGRDDGRRAQIDAMIQLFLQQSS